MPQRAARVYTANQMPTRNTPLPGRQPLLRLEDVRGVLGLAVQGIAGVTHIAEGLHSTISRAALPLGRSRPQRARGIAGFVYGTVRGSSALVGSGLDAALARIQSALPRPAPQHDPASTESPQRLAILAALNGVLGDHLERTANPLAIAMELRVPPVPGPDLVLFVHGLCMNDRQWTRKGHDHGRALHQALGCTPVYLRYNSGRHVSLNGAELAARLEQLVARWPVPLERIAIVGHSMGGLIARSAVHQAQEAGMAWPAHLDRMVFLGTPHHGAALERGGNVFHSALGASPYLAPFTRLGALRSDGITDLRHGNVLAADWEPGKFVHRDTRTPVPLPRHVACYAVAALRGDGRIDRMLGDGLVSVDSALGRHSQASRDLQIPPRHTFIARGVHHLGLLDNEAVFHRLREWLGPQPAPKARPPKRIRRHPAG